MRLSKTIMGTLREVPNEAEIKSHQLMLRAGLMRKSASGIYNYLPLGVKALKNVENIVREEMNNKDAVEILCSAIIPAELWKESGRWEVFGPEMFKLQDRNGRDFCLGPTHEEVFTDLIRNEVKSYKQLPLNLYQIQTKYRDERRPRFGVMRSREFIMKDAYSFDKSNEGLDLAYDKMYDAYHIIFNRCGLETKCVEADSGAMGGSGSAEFMVKSEVGEDEIAFCTGCSYAANVEKAEAIAEKCEKEDCLKLSKIETPDVRTIEELVSFLNSTSKKFAKTLIYKADDKVAAVMVRGDREVNEIKVINKIGGVIDFNLADEKTVIEATDSKIGYAGPIGIKVDYLLVDNEIRGMSNFIVGANEEGFHIKNVNYGRDFEGIVGDFRKVVEGDICPKCGGKLTIARGIEVGHIFKLGTKYSKAFGADFIDEDGKSKPVIMGCYGIGINRTLAAVIEQHNDERGIIWPLQIAPYQVIIIPISNKNEEQMKLSEQLYKEIGDMGIDVLFDDRAERPGVKFNDADLIGIPMRITVGKKASEGILEFKIRDKEETELIERDKIIDRIREEYKFRDLNIRR